MTKAKKWQYKKLHMVLAFMLFCVSLSGCGKEKELPEGSIKVYYVNSNETGIVSNDYVLQASEGDTNAAIAELMGVLKTMPDRLQYEAPISGNNELIGYSMTDKVLTLNFESSYMELGRTIEILDRAAIVRTFTQLDSVDYVSFQIEGTPLTDHYGNIVGNMSADTFIYNVGNEINTYEKVQLKLYFVTAEGNKLSPVYRSVVYNSNISMERLAVEQIINGPNTDIVFPSVSKDTKIKSVNVKDGVCYIDFDNGFLNPVENVTPDAAIYSIVNTITELPSVNKVAFSVNGEDSFTFMEFLISGQYERNLDIVD
ncbi:GerMN domain-containing protein [Butyrivibrio sp. MC2021]|uniref:GerMN domain-containing protein n=1 Tax=Butyrivibrio sp. MC2021 TaxID=1408306 RepID=UPI00055D5044|nr:GerMN domain-containing protein [Butyrivibrio sp. MC2021]